MYILPEGAERRDGFLIEMEHATKRYGRITALRDVSFRIGEARVTGLLGRNGAGKTTALNLLTGYFPPEEGRVLVDGVDMMKNPRECKRKIGYLPEKPPLYDEMTVREYLGFVCDLREVVPGAKKKHVEEILGLCALEEVRDRVIGHLSKGYRQRTGIAQALCGSPEVLILDEPTVGLDPMQVVEIRELIRQLGREHTIIFSSHILSEVQQLCSSALILHEGQLRGNFDLGEKAGQELWLRLQAVGQADTLIPALRSIESIRKIEKLPGEEGCASLRIFCLDGDSRGRTTDQIFHLLAALDAPIREMTRERDSLEETFLEITGRE